MPKEIAKHTCKTEAAAIKMAKKYPQARVEHSPECAAYKECWYVLIPAN